MHVCMYVYVCMYVCVCVCMYACMYVCVYVCTYVCIYVKFTDAIFVTKYQQLSNTYASVTEVPYKAVLHPQNIQLYEKL